MKNLCFVETLESKQTADLKPKIKTLFLDKNKAEEFAKFLYDEWKLTFASYNIHRNFCNITFLSADRTEFGGFLSVDRTKFCVSKRRY